MGGGRPSRHCCNKITTDQNGIYKPRPRRSPAAVLVALLLLISGVERNPGPVLRPSSSAHNAVAFGLLNARSAVHKATLIHDVIADQKLDVLALTETWITSDAPDTVKLDIAPPGYQVLRQSRGSSSDKRGGGVAFIHADTRWQHRCSSVFGQSVSASPKQTQFEVLAAQLTMRPTVHVTVVCIYRPPASVSRQFCEKLAGLLDQLVTAKQQFIVCGDFNCPGNDQLYSPHMVVTIYRYTIT